MPVDFHEQAVLHEYLGFPEESHGRGVVTSEEPLDWIALKTPNDRYGLSMTGREDCSVQCEVVTETSLALRSNPIAFLDRQGRIEYFQQTQNMSLRSAEESADALPEPDIVLQVGANASLVFRGRQELAEFLDQCAKIQADLPT